MSRSFLCLIAITLTASLAPAYAVDLAISADSYRTAGLFTSTVLPEEGSDVNIVVRARCEGDVSDPITARLTLLRKDGATVAERNLILNNKGALAEGSWTWKAAANGLYKVVATVDPDNAIAESNEHNNSASLDLPVIVAGRTLHFAWYRDEPYPRARWTTCVTSTQGDPEPLAERGVKALAWASGGMSWSSYDTSLLESDPERFWREGEDAFYKGYTSRLTPGIAGQGIDELGGYPGSFSAQASAMSMKALVRAKREQPDRFFAVWKGGGVEKNDAQYVRYGADLFILETYLWRAIPEDLGVEDIYATIRVRLEPYIRSFDMILPAYGNPCYTLIGLDTSERPDNMALGEQEQVVRFIRQSCPEMRGLAFYNAGYGGYGITRTPEIDKHHQAALDNADRLCFEYFIKPCVTLMERSLWATRDDRGWVLTAAVSNIGGMDSAPVTVEFLVDGKAVGRQTAVKVPAGPNRNHNRALLKQRITPKPGLHRFEARIVTAPDDATVLDATVGCERFLQ